MNTGKQCSLQKICAISMLLFLYVLSVIYVFISYMRHLSVPSAVYIIIGTGITYSMNVLNIHLSKDTLKLSELLSHSEVSNTAEVSSTPEKRV